MRRIRYTRSCCRECGTALLYLDRAGRKVAPRPDKNDWTEFYRRYTGPEVIRTSQSTLIIIEELPAWENWL